jgi:hypothetical protein
MQGALWDEDAAAAEGGWGLGDRNCAEAGNLADEPEAGQEAAGLDRPGGPLEPVNGSEVLSQCAEVSVVTGLPRLRGPRHDRRGSRGLISPQGKLVKELAHGVLEILTRASALGDDG